MRHWLMAAPVLALALAAGDPASAIEERNPVEIEEWEVPWEGTRPRDPFVAGPDAVWFVGQRGNYLAKFVPSTGAFARRDLDDRAGPHNLVVGRDGIVWYAGNLRGYIGRYDPASDEIEKIAMPDPAARDPHTLVFDRDRSHIWFTVQGGNFVGRLTVADRSVELIEVPTAHARPYGIAVAPDGTPWVALVGTNKLASVDAGAMTLTEHVLPDEGARPRRLAVTSDGKVFYVDYAGGKLGRLDPVTGSVDEWVMPSGRDARPYGMAVDGQDRIWFVETGYSPNTFVGFSPRTEEFFSTTQIPSGAGSVRHMDHHEDTRTVWFGTDAGTIGRAGVDVGPPPSR